MTEEHKSALALGRAEGKIVKDYLVALRSNKPKRGRKRTAESINAQIATIDAALGDADALEELKLIQERMNLVVSLGQLGETVDIAALEAAFVSVAKSYSDRQKISYAAWRAVNVEASVLKAAGIGRAD